MSSITPGPLVTTAFHSVLSVQCTRKRKFLALSLISVLVLVAMNMYSLYRCTSSPYPSPPAWYVPLHASLTGTDRWGSPDLAALHVSLGPAGTGGQYVTGSDASSSSSSSSFPRKKKNNRVSQEFRLRLRDAGLEPVEDHVFKSPYIVSPHVYPAPRRQRGDVRVKVVSFYNAPAWFGPGVSVSYNRDMARCPYHRCLVDTAGDLTSRADLVVFYMAYTTGSHVTPPPRPRGQMWVMAIWEPPVHYDYADNYEQWKSAFNLTMTYRLDSDIPVPYSLLAWRDRDQLFSGAKYLEIANQKRRTAAWFVSHCDTSSQRLRYVQVMKKYIDVDIYGKCGDLTCGSDKTCKQLLATTYSFYLSFENSFCDGYVTEKFFRNFEDRVPIIPVTRGGLNYTRYFPRGSFVDAEDFTSARDLALHLKAVADDKRRYAWMLREKDRLVGLGIKLDWCDVCQRLHTGGFPPKVIPDIRHWSHTGTCSYPNVTS